MGADAFFCWYGLSDEVDETFDPDGDERVRRAHAAGLDTWYGQENDDGVRFVLIGTPLGHIGGENQDHVRVPDAALAAIRDRTRARLRAAGFDATPALHMQANMDY